MNQTIKNFWANRRQNAWIVVEIALVAILSFYFLDYFVVSFYDTHLCRPAGDFERDHLVVGQVGVSPEADSDSIGEASFANLYALRDKVRALPEVQYAGLASDFVGEGPASPPFAPRPTPRAGAVQTRSASCLASNSSRHRV